MNWGRSPVLFGERNAARTTAEWARRGVFVLCVVGCIVNFPKLAAVQLLQSGIILHVGFPYKTVYQWLAGQRMMALPFFI
jgi:hypothetical protein